MRYKYISAMGLILALSYILGSGCGPTDNFQNQQQISISSLSLQSSFYTTEVYPPYSGANPPTNISSNFIQVTFSEPFDITSMQSSFRLTESVVSDGQAVVTDLTASTNLSAAGNVAVFSITANGGVLMPNAKYELTIFQTATSALSGGSENLKRLVIYKMFSGANFEQTGNTAFTDPARKPFVVDVNYYEICGQPYMYIFFNEDLQRAPLVRVKTGLIGTFIGTGDPTYATWPAYSGRMDVFGVHINSGGALSGHKIKIFKNDVVDLQGDNMTSDYEKGGLFQLISPCP